MSFGSRRFLSSAGRYSPATQILFTGVVGDHTQATISNDVNGNTVLGNGSYSSADDLVSSAGTGGFSNAPMNILLTPDRVYTIKIIRDTSEGSDRPWPYVKTNVAATTASLDIRYSRINGLANPPESFPETLAEYEFGTDEIGSGEPTVDGSVRTFLFDNAPWVNDKIILVEGLSVISDYNSTDGETYGSTHTPLGLNVDFTVAQSSNAGTPKVLIEVTEGYF